MKSALRYLLPSALLVFFFSSCSNKGPKEAGLIPKTASVVLVLDPGSMQDKLTAGGISVDTLLSRVFTRDSSDSENRKELDEFRNNAGINWKSQLFFFFSQKGNPKEASTTVMNVMGGIADVSKFEQWVKTQKELSKKTITKEKNYSYVLAEDNTMLSWTDKNVLVTIYNHLEVPKYDTITEQFNIPEKKNVEADLKKEVDGYFTQEKSASMADVAAFTKMFKDRADGYFFSSSNASLNALSMLPLSLPKVEELLKDNYSTATLSFEDGKIVAKSATYTNPVLSNVLKQYAGPTVNLSMIEKYPSDKINGIVMASFNPEIFGGLLKQLEVEGLVNGMMEKTGFSAQDLYKSLKGDIAVVVSDLGTSQPEPQEKKDEKDMMGKKPMGKMIFNAPVGDKVSFAKLMDKAAESGYIKKVGSTYKSGELMAMLGIYMVADDKNFIIASDSITYTQYMSNNNKAVISTEVLNQFKGKSSVVYFDIANTLAGFMGSNGDYNKSMKTAKETFKDVIGTSDNFDGNSIKGVFEVRMQNEKQNSLVTLTSLITDIAVDMRVANKRQKLLEERAFPGGIPAMIRTN
nr:DUF4836 family protein [uncultured Sediminibacterium sp.]